MAISAIKPGTQVTSDPGAPHKEPGDNGDGLNRVVRFEGKSGVVYFAGRHGGGAGPWREGGMAGTVLPGSSPPAAEHLPGSRSVSPQASEEMRRWVLFE